MTDDQDLILRSGAAASRRTRPALRTLANPPAASPKALLNEAESCRLVAAAAKLFAETRGGPLGRAFAREAARAEWRLASIRKRMMAVRY